MNNAGIGALGRFDEADPARIRRLFEVNFFAAAELIREALPLLKQGTRPIVVNIGSILGHFATPRSSEYCATKFALRGFTDALRAEFAAMGIDVLLVSPGTTESEFFEHVVEETSAPRWAKQRGVSAESVARATRVGNPPRPRREHSQRAWPADLFLESPRAGVVAPDPGSVWLSVKPTDDRP